MAKRDYIREHIGELVEELLIKAKEDSDMYLERADIRLEQDGVVSIRVPRLDGTEYYTVRVTHHV